MKPKLRHVVPALPDIAWRHHSPPFAEARESHHRAAGLHRVALKGREGKRIRELQDHLAVSGLAVIDQHGEAGRRAPPRLLPLPFLIPREHEKELLLIDLLPPEAIGVEKRIRDDQDIDIVIQERLNQFRGHPGLNHHFVRPCL